jgi:hypothetical protein
MLLGQTDPPNDEEANHSGRIGEYRLKAPAALDPPSRIRILS